MAIKVTIGNREVKNPVAKILIAFVSAVILLIGFVVAFLVILPVIWVVGLCVLLLVLTALVSAPKLFSKYKINVITDRMQD